MAASLLPPNATALERAVEGASAAGWATLDPAAIARAKDPWTCPESLLPFLAFEHAVDLWVDAWPTWKKRSVIASAAADKRLKGTEAGARRYLEIADAELLEVVTLPQGFFASPDLSKAQWDALIARHPQLRITLARGTGHHQAPDGIFADATFADHACATVDAGRALLGRRAVMVQDGRETPLQLVTIEQSSETRTAELIERVVVPGRSAGSVVADAAFAGHAYADARDKAPAYYSFSLARAYQHQQSRVALQTVSVGFEPRDTRFRRESARGTRGRDIFEGGFAGQDFATRDRGGELIADILYLHDPAVAVPQIAGMSFADHSRVAMDHHSAEMLVDWRERMPPGSAFIADRSFAGRDPAADADTTRRDFLLATINRSARVSDRIRATFQTRRARTLGDGLLLDGAAPLGADVPNHL